MITVNLNLTVPARVIMTTSHSATDPLVLFVSAAPHMTALLAATLQALDVSLFLPVMKALPADLAPHTLQNQIPVDMLGELLPDMELRNLLLVSHRCPSVL